jgi:hypothetical protein
MPERMFVSCFAIARTVGRTEFVTPANLKRSEEPQNSMNQNLLPSKQKSSPATSRRGRCVTYDRPRNAAAGRGTS